MAEEILELEVNSNVKGVIKDVDNLTDAVENTNTAYTKLNTTVGRNNKEQQDADKLIMRGIENFRVFGFSIRSVRNNLKLIGPISKKLFGTIKSGIAATGVGLLVIAFGTLMGALMGTKKGAALLKAGIEGLKVVFAPFLYVIEQVADGLTWLFGIESTPAVSAAEQLEKAYDRLGKEMDKIALKELKGQKSKVDNKRVIDDITKSEEERIAASKENAEADKEILAAKIAAQEKVLAVAKKGLAQNKSDYNWEKKRALDRDDWHEVANDNESAFSKTRDATTKSTKALNTAEQELEKLRNQVYTDSLAAEDELAAIRETAAKKAVKDKEIADKKAEATREKNRNKWIADQKKTAADELAIARQLEKIKQELYYRTLETVEEVEAAKLKHANDAAKQEILDSTASKEVKDAAIKELDIKYFDDLAVIVKKYSDKEDEETKVADEKLATIRQENMLLAIEDERDLADKKLEIQRDAELKSAELMENSVELKKEILKKYSKIQGDINTKRGEDDKKIADASTSDQIAAYGNLAGALSGLAGDNKELAAASAIIDTYAGANKAFAQGGVAGFVTAGAIIAAGLSNIQKIYATDVGDGGGGGGGGDVASVPPAPQMMSGAFELTGGQAVEPARAYVVSDDITNNQNKLAIIRRRATI
jgi:hypothetical protein